MESQGQAALLDRAEHQLLAGESGEALGSLERFLAVQDGALDAGQLTISERILDSEFHRSRERVLPLYRRLVALGSRRHLTVMLTLECVLSEGDLAACATLVRFLGKPDAAWEHRILGRYFLAAGDRARAAQHYLAAGRRRLDHFPMVAEMMENLRKLGDSDAALTLLKEARGHQAPPEVALLELRLADVQPGLAPDLEQACTSSFAEAGAFVKYLRGAGERIPRERLTAIYVALEKRFPDSAALLSGIAALEAERRERESALRWIRRALECARGSPEEPKVRFQAFQLTCEASVYEEARTLLGGVKLDTLKPEHKLYVSRFFAEQSEWQKALDFVAQALPQLGELDQAGISLVARVGRKSGGQYALLQAIAGCLPDVSPSKHRAAMALYEDWVCSAGLGHPEAGEIARALGLSVTQLLDFKLSVLAPERLAALNLSDTPARTRRRALFYCTDRAYLLPALVSLASLLHHNRRFDAADFHMVVADEVAGLAAGVLDILGRHFSVRLSATPASALAHDAAGLRPSFGAFTGGQFLSEAAYYRIYMARKLAQTGDYDQLLYLDSDSVIGHGFDAIVDLPAQESTLLMARIDAELPGVKIAIGRFGLRDGRYFNSGVLWFPRVGERLIQHLDDTIRVAVQRNAELMFLDQCALNVAFADTFEPLPARFNFFTGPEKAAEFLQAPASELCFIHMLNRLKPWDSAYPPDSPIQRRWVSELRALRRIVGDAPLRALLQSTP
jgi:lipopolysaccharide biosynthesis glycosyltransferase